MSVRLAVISDLHCHPTTRKGLSQASYLLTDAMRLPAGHHPVEALLDLIEETDLRADVVLVPGDLTDKVDKQGMLTGWSAVKEITGALRANLLATTLGNHDADSREKHMRGDAFHVPRHLGRDYPVASADARREFWSEGFCILDHPAVRVLVINSAVEHRSASFAERGSVTDELLQNLRRRLASLDRHDTQVALVHHHPIPHEDSYLGSEDLMVNGSLLLNLLGENGYRILVHGHKHHPRLRYYDVGGESVLVFAAGSFAALPSQFFKANLFHIVEVGADVLPGCSQTGWIRTWAFTYGVGWAPAHPERHLIPSDVGFGCLEDPETLAQRAAALVPMTENGLMRWPELVSRMPELKFLLPAHLATFSDRLATLHGIDVNVSRMDGLPSVLVRHSD